MIAAQADCRELLRCPASGARLHFADDGAAVSLGSGRRYEAVGGIPVLIDFDNSVVSGESVFTSPTGVVARPRHQGLARVVKRLLSPEKRETRINIGEFIEQLKASDPTPRVLVIGGGTVGQGLGALYDDPALKLLAFDLYWSAQAQFIADAHAIPLPDDCIDGVVIQAVLEHVLEPQRVVAEIWRVLKDAGLVYAETPFLQQVHEGAYDFTRFTESGHRYLFRRFGLIRSGPCGGIGTQLSWSIDYFVRSLFRSSRAGKVAKLAFCWLHWLDRFIPASYASDAASGVYFLGRKAQVEVTPREVVAFYRGAQRATVAG